MKVVSVPRLSPLERFATSFHRLTSFVGQLVVQTARMTNNACHVKRFMTHNPLRYSRARERHCYRD
jgi:hypothetical protein